MKGKTILVAAMALFVSGVSGEAKAQTLECAYSEANQHVVVGDFSGCTGVDAAVYGENSSAGGIGVKGTATATSGVTRGVVGISDSAEGAGVVGRSTYTGGGAGVYGVMGQIDPDSSCKRTS